MTELKFEGKANIVRTAVAVNDPGDSVKALRSLKIQTIVNSESVNALLGNDAELFWQDELKNPRWFAIKKVVMNIALTRHECCLCGMGLGAVTLKGFEFLPVGIDAAELTLTIIPDTPPNPVVADKLQAAVNRTAVDISIWRIPETATHELRFDNRPGDETAH